MVYEELRVKTGWIPNTKFAGFFLCQSTDGQIRRPYQKEYADAEWFASLHFQSFLKINENINKAVILDLWYF